VFENCKWNKVALKIAYDGQKYMGFEKNEAGNGNTIEDHLFQAMKNVQVINTDEPL
jgi:tRNA U38,U39,U40 pseudouridine synthase TruA